MSTSSVEVDTTGQQSPRQERLDGNQGGAPAPPGGPAAAAAAGAGAAETAENAAGAAAPPPPRDAAPPVPPEIHVPRDETEPPVPPRQDAPRPSRDERHRQGDYSRTYFRESERPRGSGTTGARGASGAHGAFGAYGAEEDREERWSMRDRSSDDSDDSQDTDLERRIRKLTKKLKKSNQLRPKEPAKYDGTSKYSELENWLHSVEMYLRAKHMLRSHRALDYVATLLSGSAATWWRYHRIAVRNGTAQRINSWEEFQDTLLAHFRPEDAERIAREKLQRCSQQGSVRDYNQRFQHIMIELPEMNEKDRIYAYFTGLKSQVRLQVELQYPKTLKTAMELAELSDSTLYRAQQGAKTGYNRQKSQSSSNSNSWTGKRVNNIVLSNGSGKETRTCYYCGKAGHLKSACNKLAADKKAGKVAPSSGGKSNGDWRKKKEATSAEKKSLN